MKSDGANACDERFSEWLQHPARDPVCWDLPVCGHHTGFICVLSMGAAGGRPEFDIKPSLEAPLLIFPQSYLLMSLQLGDASARQRGLKSEFFPLLGELPKAIEPHLPVCQLCRWQLREHQRCQDIGGIHCRLHHTNVAGRHMTPGLSVVIQEGVTFVNFSNPVQLTLACLGCVLILNLNFNIFSTAV